MTAQPPGAPHPGTGSEQDRRDRLARLREEVTRLEEELGDGPAPGGGPGPAGPRATWWRGPVVVLCLVLLAVCAPLAVVATWAHDEVSDTDRYVDTVAPLADDPAAQAAVSDRLTEEVVQRLRLEAVTAEALDALAQRVQRPLVATSLTALATPLADAITGFVRTHVERLVRSSAFADAWVEANRQAHGQLVAVLTGEGDEAVQLEGNTVRLNLAVLIGAVKTRLSERGFTLAERIPEVRAEFTLLESADIGKAHSLFRWLDAAARALPVAALVLLAGAVLAARRRRRTLVAGALVVAGSMLVLGLSLNVLRSLYLDGVSSEQLPPSAAAVVYDQLVSFIRLNLRAVLVLFLAVAAVAWVTGPDRTPTAVRSAAGRAFSAVRRRSDDAGLDTGPLGRVLGTYRAPLRGLVLGTAVLLYVLRDHPTGAWSLGLLAATVLVLLVLELLARPDDTGQPDGSVRGAASTPA